MLRTIDIAPMMFRSPCVRLSGESRKRQSIGQVVGVSHFATALLVAAGSLNGSSLAALNVTGVVDVGIVQRLTGPGPTGHVAIGGTDLGHMVNHQGSTYFLFGDTFSGETPAAGGNWRSNVMARSNDVDPTDGVIIDAWITNAAGKAREVIHSGLNSPITEIPTGAISANGRIYAWYMAVDWWGPSGEWTNSYAGLASWQVGQSTFDVVDGFAFPGNSNFGMVAASLRDDLADASDDHVYLWGTPAGRLGGVKLARVDPLEIGNHSAYEYYGGIDAGQPTWVSSEFNAPLIVEPTVGEMSVMYNQALGSWTMLSMNHDNYAIELRQAAAPWGPWSDAVQVVSGWEYPGLYGSYMNPLYVEDGGKTIYFTMSLWNPYDVFLMKASFETAPVYAADFDADGDVDGADLGQWRDDFDVNDLSDADEDGDSDGADFLVWQRQVGSGLPPVANSEPVPEPAAISLLIVAALAKLAVQPRRKSSVRSSQGVELRDTAPSTESSRNG
jgi:hypothetical protein